MRTNIELRKRGWVFVGVQFGVKVYFKSEKMYPTKEDSPYINHVGMMKDDIWNNYCYFDGDKAYLSKHVKWFLVQIEMNRAWRKRVADYKQKSFLLASII